VSSTDALFREGVRTPLGSSVGVYLPGIAANKGVMPLELFGKENKQGIPTFMLPETVLQVMRPSFGGRWYL
jgi:hypothetical protein